MMRTDLTLLPRIKLRLSCATQVGAVRFAQIFRQTWKQIPLSVRRKILAFWRNDKPFLGFRVPLTITYYQSIEYPRSAFGRVKHDGRTIEFSGDLMVRLPDKHVGTVIAHELCHVYFYALGIPFDEDNENEIEESIGETIDTWGFDDSALDWLSI